MRKFYRVVLLILIVIFIIYLAGPKPDKPQLTTDLPVVAADLSILEQRIISREAGYKIKPDNESRFVWANDSLKERTEWALLYLHGFSASWHEGFPVNQEFAERYQCNAYFPRLSEHGLDTTEALLGMTPDALWESAKEALVVARRIGKKVLVMSTSTGGTLALKLAAEFPEYVDGLILYSPNVQIHNPAAFLLSKPWGIHIARAVYKSKYRVTNEDFSSLDCQYSYCRYRLEAVVYLQQLVENTMRKEVFERVVCPVFLGYYYKDEENQDQVIRVDAALRMYEQLGTSADEKMEQAFPEAGNHIIAGEVHSKSIEDVKTATLRFAEKTLKMTRP